MMRMTPDPVAAAEWVEENWSSSENTELWNRVLVLIEHARATLEPEIVTAVEAEELPEASIVKPASDVILPWTKIDGKWHRYGTPIADQLPDHGPWLVLYRAPEPVKPLAVGDTVTTVAELDRLPDGSVIRSKIEARSSAEKIGDRWSVPGFAETVDLVASQWLPARILDLPEDA